MRSRISFLPVAKGILFFSAKHPISQINRALPNTTSVCISNNVNFKMMHSSSRSFSKLTKPPIEGSHVLSLWSFFAILSGDPKEPAPIREVYINIKLSDDKKGYLIECARGTTLLNDHMQNTIPKKVVPLKIVSNTEIYVAKENTDELRRFLEENRSRKAPAQEESSREKSHMPRR